MPHGFPMLAVVVGLTWLAACQPMARPASGSPETAGPAPVASAAAFTQEPLLAATAVAPAPPTTSGSSPLAISAMRARSYPGSDIVLEQVLEAGAGYSRYIVSYQSDGLRLFGLLAVPRGNKPAGGWPVILLNHGYIPPAAYSSEQSYAGIVAPLAGAGYIVLMPDYRGHGYSPGTPYQPYVAPDYVTDSLNALASIKRFEDANADRVGVWGHSMGGNVTLHELVISSEFKAAVLMAGAVGSYSSILDWWQDRVATGVLTTENDLETNQIVLQMVELNGTPQNNPGFWNAIDPTTFVSDVHAPVLIQVGTADKVVPPEFSQGLAAQLQAAGKSVTLRTYPSADHNLAPDTAAAMAEAVAFFDQHLK